MSKLIVNRFKKMGVLLIVCTASSTLGFVMGSSRTNIVTAKQPSSRQSDEKLIERKVLPREPLEVSDLRVKKVKVVPSQKFSAMSLSEKAGGPIEDWLENLEFSLKNTTDRKITYILLEIQFPETEVNGPMMVNHLRIGIPPKASGEQSKYYEPLDLNPENKFTYTLPARELKLMKEFLALRKFHLEDLNKAIIKIAYVIFYDGIMWFNGDYYRPNPNVQGGYERIDQ